MSATNFTPIQLYRTSTAAAVPTAGSLAAGELAINLTDERLYFKNAAGVVKLLASNSGSLGTVTSVDVSGGTTGLTTSGGPITSSGTITLGGTLGVANGGTGTTTAFTAGSVVFAGASGVYSQDNANFFWDDTNNRLGIGTATPPATLSAVSSSNGSIMFLRRGGGTYNPGLYVNLSDTINNEIIFNTTYSTGSAPSYVWQNADAEIMRLNNTGLGIGTTSPGYKLDVVGTSNTQIGVSTPSGDAGSIASPIYQAVRFFGYAGTERARITSLDTAANNVNGQLAFWTGQAGTMVEAMRIDAVSNVGIGTGTPASPLNIVRDNAAFRGQLSLQTVSAANFAQITFYDQSTLSGQIYQGYGSDKEINIVNPLAAGIALWTTNTERMRIDSAGDVGIGTTTPEKLLSVSNAGANGFEIEPREGNFTRLISYNRSTAAYTPVLLEGLDLRFLTNNGNERMRIDSSGNVGIGTTAPVDVLQVSRSNATTGTGIVSPVGLTLQNTSSTAGNYTTIQNRDASGSQNAQIQFINVTQGSPFQGAIAFTTRASVGDFAERMRIDASGNVGIGTSSPASKLHVANGSLTLTDVFGLNWGAGSTYVYGSSAANFLGFATNNAERMRIDSSGNVGIGASPLSFTPLYIYRSGSDAGLRAERASGAALDMFATASTAYFGTATNHPLIFQTNNTERMRIDSSGNLLVGTTSSFGRVVASQSGSADVFYAAIGTGGSAFTVAGSGSTMTAGYFVTSSGLAGSITCSGTSTSYNTSSDARLKDNVADADDAASLIDALQVRKFDWKADGSHQRYGFVAQELVTVAPEAVSQPEDPEEMMGVDYSKLVPMLVKEIQSLRARVAQLEGN